MFKYMYKVPKSEYKTTYGSLQISNIIFEPEEIEKALPEIVFDETNLMHMFAEDNLSVNKRKNIYRRFIPKSEIKPDIETFVKNSISTNRSFYSFLAEGLLGLVFRDLYDFDLAKGVIDIGETLSDSHTGVDACLYNLNHNVIVLGEAKFYDNLTGGMNKIIDDFVNKSIKNKVESLQTKVENCDNAVQIVIKNLKLDEYDELTIDQFMKQKIIFAGFVLHSESDISNYNDKDFYAPYVVSTSQLESNINKSLGHNDIEGEYEIILVHLPIKNKTSLIVEIISTSIGKMLSMRR